MPFQFARALLHDAPHHLVSFTIDLHSWSLTGVPISTSQAQRISKSEDSWCARALRVHYTPQRPRSCIIEKHSFNCISVPNFVLLAQSFPKVKALLHMHSARAKHVHYAPHHQMACTKEIRSLNSLSPAHCVDSSKFPKTGGPFSNKLFRYWLAQPASYWIGNHKNIWPGVAYMLPASLVSAVPTIWPLGAAKEQQVQNISTCTARAQCSPPP